MIFLPVLAGVFQVADRFGPRHPHTQQHAAERCSPYLKATSSLEWLLLSLVACGCFCSLLALVVHVGLWSQHVFSSPSPTTNGLHLNLQMQFLSDLGTDIRARPRPRPPASSSLGTVDVCTVGRDIVVFCLFVFVPPPHA